MFKYILNLLLVICFLITGIGPLPKAHADSVLGLPEPGAMVNLSPAYMPVIMKGLKVHPENPLLFDFILDSGDSALNINSPQFKAEAQKLIKYFLASLTIKEDDLWVNLSPYEKNRMITKELGVTELGQDMLAQDYILKQLTASLIYPEKQLGKEFWNRIYSKTQEMFGTSEIPVNTFNKVWIMADRAKVLQRNNVGYIIGAHLKVMLEEDYLALQKNKNNLSFPNDSAHGRESRDSGVGNPSTAHSIASQIVREIILPEIEKEVNEGKNFANLRQIFYSMILSTWYKQALKNAFLNQVYTDRGKTSGVLSHNPAATEKIYEQYLKAYKKGVFNYIKEDINPANQQMIPRKYFSGGIPRDFAMKVTTEAAPTAQEGETLVDDSGKYAEVPTYAVPETPDTTPDEYAELIAGFMFSHYITREFPPETTFGQIFEVFIAENREAYGLDFIIDQMPLTDAEISQSHNVNDTRLKKLEAAVDKKVIVTITRVRQKEFSKLYLRPKLPAIMSGNEGIGSQPTGSAIAAVQSAFTDEELEELDAMDHEGGPHRKGRKNRQKIEEGKLEKQAGVISREPASKTPTRNKVERMSFDDSIPGERIKRLVYSSGLTHLISENISDLPAGLQVNKPEIRDQFNVEDYMAILKTTDEEDAGYRQVVLIMLRSDLEVLNENDIWALVINRSRISNKNPIEREIALQTLSENFTRARSRIMRRSRAVSEEDINMRIRAIKIILNWIESNKGKIPLSEFLSLKNELLEIIRKGKEYDALPDFLRDRFYPIIRDENQDSYVIKEETQENVDHEHPETSASPSLEVPSVATAPTTSDSTFSYTFRDPGWPSSSLILDVNDETPTLADLDPSDIDPPIPEIAESVVTTPTTIEEPLAIGEPQADSLRREEVTLINVWNSRGELRQERLPLTTFSSHPNYVQVALGGERVLAIAPYEISQLRLMLTGDPEDYITIRQSSDGRFRLLSQGNGIHFNLSNRNTWVVHGPNGEDIFNICVTESGLIVIQGLNDGGIVEFLSNGKPLNQFAAQMDNMLDDTFRYRQAVKPNKNTQVEKFQEIPLPSAEILARQTATPMFSNQIVVRKTVSVRQGGWILKINVVGGKTIWNFSQNKKGSGFIAEIIYTGNNIGNDPYSVPLKSLQEILDAVERNVLVLPENPEEFLAQNRNLFVRGALEVTAQRRQERTEEHRQEGARAAQEGIRAAFVREKRAELRATVTIDREPYWKESRSITDLNGKSYTVVAKSEGGRYLLGLVADGLSPKLVGELQDLGGDERYAALRFDYMVFLLTQEISQSALNINDSTLAVNELLGRVVRASAIYDEDWVNSIPSYQEMQAQWRLILNYLRVMGLTIPNSPNIEESFDHGGYWLAEYDSRNRFEKYLRAKAVVEFVRRTAMFRKVILEGRTNLRFKFQEAEDDPLFAQANVVLEQSKENSDNRLGSGKLNTATRGDIVSGRLVAYFDDNEWKLFAYLVDNESIQTMLLGKKAIVIAEDNANPTVADIWGQNWSKQDRTLQEMQRQLDLLNRYVNDAPDEVKNNLRKLQWLIDMKSQARTWPVGGWESPAGKHLMAINNSFFVELSVKARSWILSGVVEGNENKSLMEWALSRERSALLKLRKIKETLPKVTLPLPGETYIYSDPGGEIHPWELGSIINGEPMSAHGVPFSTALKGDLRVIAQVRVTEHSFEVPLVANPLEAAAVEPQDLATTKGDELVKTISPQVTGAWIKYVLSLEEEQSWEEMQRKLDAIKEHAANFPAAVNENLEGLQAYLNRKGDVTPIEGPLNEKIKRFLRSSAIQAFVVLSQDALRLLPNAVEGKINSLPHLALERQNELLQELGQLTSKLDEHHPIQEGDYYMYFETGRWYTDVWTNDAPLTTSGSKFLPYAIGKAVPPDVAMAVKSDEALIRQRQQNHQKLLVALSAFLAIGLSSTGWNPTIRRIWLGLNHPVAGSTLSPGGIDFNAKKMSLEVTGSDIQMKFNPAIIARLRKGDFTGIEGIIIRIQALQSPLSILGMSLAG